MKKTKLIDTLLADNDLTATEFSTVADKEKFIRSFVSLVESGFNPNKFTKAFYISLSNTFGHIAHYNQGGFWDAQLSTLSRRINFLNRALEYGCYGSAAYTHCDAEKIIQKWIGQSGIIEKLQEQFNREIETREREILASLKAKYETQQA